MCACVHFIFLCNRQQRLSDFLQTTEQYIRINISLFFNRQFYYHQWKAPLPTLPLSTVEMTITEAHNCIQPLCQKLVLLSRWMSTIRPSCMMFTFSRPVRAITLDIFQQVNSRNDDGLAASLPIYPVILPESCWFLISFLHYTESNYTLHLVSDRLNTPELGRRC